MANVRKHIILPGKLLERAKIEEKRIGVNFSPMVCIALDEWLVKQERKRKKENVMETLNGIEKVKELYNFLTGIAPDGIFFDKTQQPIMLHDKAFAIIYYLQEQLQLIPDTFELCWNCKEIYDSANEGLYCDVDDRHYCNCCLHLAPDDVWKT